MATLSAKDDALSDISVVEDTWTARYSYSVGEVAAKFLNGLKERKILASKCSASGLVYLPPRAYCERSFEPCDQWIEAGMQGTLEVATIVAVGFAGSPPPPYVVAFVRLDRVDTAIGGYVKGMDLTDIEAASKQLKPGTRMAVEFIDEPIGKVTDFHFVIEGQTA